MLHVFCSDTGLIVDLAGDCLILTPCIFGLRSDFTVCAQILTKFLDFKNVSYQINDCGEDCMWRTVQIRHIVEGDG